DDAEPLRDLRQPAYQGLLLAHALTDPRIDRLVDHAGLGEEEEQVTPEQPLRQRGLTRADGDVGLPARREFVGDLVAGVAAADHQRRGARQIRRPAISAAVHLRDLWAEVTGDSGHARLLERTGRNH